MYAISNERARRARLAIVLAAGFFFLPVTAGHVGQIGYASAWAGDQGGGHDQVRGTQSYTNYSASAPAPVPDDALPILPDGSDGQRVCAARSTELHELFRTRQPAGDGTLPILYERSDGQRVHAAIQPVNDTSKRPRHRQRDVSFQ